MKSSFSSHWFLKVRVRQRTDSVVQERSEISQDLRGCIPLDRFCTCFRKLLGLFSKSAEKHPRYREVLQKFSVACKNFQLSRLGNNPAQRKHGPAVCELDYMLARLR